MVYHGHDTMEAQRVSGVQILKGWVHFLEEWKMLGMQESLNQQLDIESAKERAKVSSWHNNFQVLGHE